MVVDGDYLFLFLFERGFLQDQLLVSHLELRLQLAVLALPLHAFLVHHDVNLLHQLRQFCLTARPQCALLR